MIGARLDLNIHLSLPKDTNGALLEPLIKNKDKKGPKVNFHFLTNFVDLPPVISKF
jgi:hypothetical protein